VMCSCQDYGTGAHKNIQWCYSCVTAWCYSCVTAGLSGVAVVLQWCSSGVTVVVQGTRSDVFMCCVCVCVHVCVCLCVRAYVCVGVCA
jgi:hypothetical protein